MCILHTKVRSHTRIIDLPMCVILHTKVRSHTSIIDLPMCVILHTKVRSHTRIIYLPMCIILHTCNFKINISFIHFWLGHVNHPKKRKKKRILQGQQNFKDNIGDCVRKMGRSCLVLTCSSGTPWLLRYRKPTVVKALWIWAARSAITSGSASAGFQKQVAGLRPSGPRSMTGISLVSDMALPNWSGVTGNQDTSTQNEKLNIWIYLTTIWLG